MNKKHKGTYKKHILDFHSGSNYFSYDFLGCHKTNDGYVFRVWAPNAQSIRVVGSFNSWDISTGPMQRISEGIWEHIQINAKPGDIYKYYIERPDGTFVYKSDPYGYHMDLNALSASVIYDLDGFKWTDSKYIKSKANKKFIQHPINIYEVHLGSWKKSENDEFINYAEIADDLIDYVKNIGYTHIEIMPIAEYPYNPSWGYQVTGYFAPTSRYGTPHDFMTFINKCHNAGIGVILDWVGAHFPKDENGLYEFDGTYCYESSNTLINEHKEWNTRIFDYGKNEVKCFLISNVLYWLDKYHIDGIRADAVSSMLYTNYGRDDDSNTDVIRKDAILMLQELNKAVKKFKKSAFVIAEESTAFPNVTNKLSDEGLGFSYKWNMGWMNDMLEYMQTDVNNRANKHKNITFSFTYAFSENYILPLSHDEVVHGKKSLIKKMPGNYEEKFANLRTFYGYMMAHPGKKLTFMGNEFAQFIEWDYSKQLDWFLLNYEKHQQMQTYVKDLNKFYSDHSQLWQNDSDWYGFNWIAHDNYSQSIIAFRRIDKKKKELICICNFCSLKHEAYRIGVPKQGKYVPLFSSDEIKYGGTGVKLKTAESEPISFHGYDNSIEIKIPPLSAIFYERII